MGVRFFKKPKLVRPFLIAGWPDAGFVGSKAISYLKQKLKADPFAQIDPFDFITSLPKSMVRGGILIRLEFPLYEFSFWKGDGEHDLVIFQGDFPQINHYKFVNLMLDVAQDMGVERIFTVGGFLAPISHKETPEVLAVVNSPVLVQVIKEAGIKLGVDYHGPTSMCGLLIGAARGRKLEGISLWGQVPNYLSRVPNPKIAKLVLEALMKLIDLKIELGDLEREAREAEEQIEKLVEAARTKQPQFDEYLRKLERKRERELRKEEVEELLEEIEDFLQHRGEGGEGRDGT